mgnify:FL=1
MKKFTFRRSTAFWTILLVSVFCLAVVLMAGPAQALPLLWLNPTNPVTSVGNVVDVDIQLDDVTDVYGAEVALSFNPTFVKVIGAQLTPGTCPQPNFVPTNTADNTAGTINYAATQLSPTAACNGGVVATITFECIAEGVSPVTFGATLISDPNGTPIAHGTQNGTVECQQVAIDIRGSVALQSWPDPSGVAVTLYDSNDVVVDGPFFVGPDGAFLLHANNEEEIYHVVAEYDRYLSAEATVITVEPGFVVNLGLVTLRAGDINGDGVINILDLTAVAGDRKSVV